MKGRELLMILRICWVVAGLWTGLALAQEPKSVSEQDFLGDMPIVLSVSRLPQRLDETPGAVSILDRRTIRMSGARDVADLLRLVPGFQVSNSFEGNAPQASYHGNWGDFANHIQVMVDGRSVYSTFLQGSTGPGLQTVAIEDIERIEVMRGSNSAAYGARAFLGTINIVTRDPLDTMGTQAQIVSGSNGIQDTLVRLGWGDDRAQYRIGVDRRADNGLSGASGPNSVSRVNFRADFQPGAGDSLELRAGQMQLDSSVGFVDQIGNAPRTRGLDSSYLQLDWRRNLGPDSDLALQISHMDESVKDRFAYVPVPGLLIDFGGRASNDNFSLQHTFRQSPDLRVVWGAELRREMVASQPLFNTTSEFVTDFNRLFGNAEWRLHADWLLNVGGMREYNSITGDHILPRAVLNWHFSPGQTLRYGVSQAYRTPSTFENAANVRYNDPSSGALLAITTVGTARVQAEGIVAREIGYLGDFPSLALNLDVRVFHEYISKFIQTLLYPMPGGLLTCTPAGVSSGSVPCVSGYFNGENFQNQGVEYQLRWKPWQDANLILNQSYVNSSWTDNGSYQGQPLTSAGVMFMQKLPGGLDFSVLYTQSNSTNFIGTANPTVVATSRTDVRLAWPLRIAAQRGEVSLVVQNMGQAYADFLPDTVFRRQAFVMLRLDN